MQQFYWYKYLELAANNIAEAVIVVDQNGDVIYANTAVEKVLKLSIRDVLYKSYRNVLWNMSTLDGKPISGESRPCSRVLKSKRPVFDERVLFKTPAGEQLVLSITSTPHINTETGQMVVIESLIDITKQKMAEDALRESESRFRKVFEKGPLGISINDPEFRFIAANPRLCELLGYTEEELRQMTFPDVTYPEDLGKDVDLAQKLFSGEIPYFQIEKRYVRKNGEAFWVNLTATAVRDEAGKVLYGLGMIEDISERKRVKELGDALNQINSSIISTLDFNEILQRVLTESAKVMDAEMAFISLNKGDYWMISHGYSFPKELIGMRARLKDLPFTTLVAAERKTIAVSDAYHDSRVDNQAMREKGVRSIMSVPLVIRNDIVGVLVFLHISKPFIFTGAEVDFANKLAASVSLALENARLYEAQQLVADTLQESLLVMPESIRGIDFGYLYHSASETAWVGGDFYDLFELNECDVGILIGDVSGKGIEATALTSVVKNAIKAHAFEAVTPAMIMSKTNNLIAKVSSPADFITMFFGVLNLKTGTLTYCSAGHPPPLLKRAKGKVKPLTKVSPMVGAFQNMNYRSGKERIEPGDMLLLYTDGVIEARCDGDFYGQERLIEFVANLDLISPRELPQAVFDDVINCTGNRLSDDIAILAVSLVETKKPDKQRDSHVECSL